MSNTLPALPPMSNVVPMPAKPKKPETITVTAGGKSTTVDAEALGRLADKLEAERKGGAPARTPGKRPVVEVDPAELAKLEKLLGEEAVAAIRDLDNAELRDRIVSLSEHEVETEQAIARDPKVKELKDALREAIAPYKETIKFLKARRRLAVLIRAERGRPT